MSMSIAAELYVSGVYTGTPPLDALQDVLSYGMVTNTSYIYHTGLYYLNPYRLSFSPSSLRHVIRREILKIL